MTLIGLARDVKYIKVVNISDEDKTLRHRLLAGGELLIRAKRSTKIPTEVYAQVWRKESRWLVRDTAAEAQGIEYDVRRPVPKKEAHDDDSKDKISVERTDAVADGIPVPVDGDAAGSVSGTPTVHEAEDRIHED